MRRLLNHRELWLLAAIVLMVAMISVRFPAFASPANLVSVFNDTAILVILSLGQMVVILDEIH